jgi:uncharacterized lipoprotein YddW (UPF0748 family)
MRARGVRAALVLGGVLAALPYAALAGEDSDPEPAPPAEYRAFWVDAFHSGIKSPQQVDQLIANAQRANVNALIVQVRKRADAYYNDALEPRASDPELAPAPYDPLAYLIKKAHAARPRLEVHAWMNVFHVGPALVAAHPDWASVRLSTGKAGAYLDPGHPAAAAYTHDVLMHVVKNYDVDGLHFDYVRYSEGGDWGYSATSLARFHAAHGGTGDPTPNDPVWSQWRRDQVTGFVRDFYSAATAAKPRLKVSAALIAFGEGPTTDAEWRQTRTFREVYQDWRTWLEDGVLDFGVVMNYDREWSPLQKAWFNRWIEWEKDHQGIRRLLVGVAAYLNYPEDTFSQLQRARSPSAAGNRVAGVAVYSYASTSPYATDDFYRNRAAADRLPRQPYARDWDPAALLERAREFNEWFYEALSEETEYVDPAWEREIHTTPPFPTPASAPRFPWKEQEDPD